MSVIALIPAHNEAEWIGKIVKNLREQTYSPSRIIVVSDNSTDATVALAEAAGAEVQVSVDNTHKKAGALNQALGKILPGLDDTDFIFIQDADTLPAPHWLEVGLAWAANRPGAVISGRYASPPTGWSMIRIVQENEFARDGRSIDRRRQRTRIVVGTSALFKVSTLRAIITARARGDLPGARAAAVFSVDSITEDYELTLALKTLGFKTFSPPECDAETDVMPSIPALWRQRIRWQRGAFTDLGKYGLTRITAWYYAAQALWCFGMLTVALIAAQITLVVMATGTFHPAAIWLETLPLFIAYRVLTVRRTGWKGMLVAGVMLPETMYDFFRYAIYLTCAFKALIGAEAKW